MKKWLLIFVFGGLLFWTWVSLRLTHTLDFYSVSTDSNRPTFKPGDIFFASRLKKPDYKNFVCFKVHGESHLYTFRCIGKPGDVIELKDAKVFRNGIMLDEPYTTNEYLIAESKLKHIRGYIEQNKNQLEPINDTIYRISLSANELKVYKLNLLPFFTSKGTTNPDLWADFKKVGCNEDNLGPIKVPENRYFFMGDNRHDAFDSRYIGFVKNDDIVATVLSH